MERERYRIHDLTVDVGAASVTRDGGEPRHLPQLSFDLLVLLIRRAPDVVSTDELIAEVWPDTVVADETLTQRVALLRRALGDTAKDPVYVRSVRGRGYQLVPEFEVLPDLPAAESSRPRWKRPVMAFVVTMLVLGGWMTFRAATGSGSAPVVTRHADVPDLLDRAETYLQRHKEADNEIAIELFERALRLEPDHPDAMAGLSLALSHRVTKFNRSLQEAEQAADLAQRAIELDGRHARAHLAFGLALDGKGRMTQALEAYSRAVEIDPRRTDALASAAHLLQVRGNLTEALKANVQVLQSGDRPPYLEVQTGATLALLGFEETAEIWFGRALELRPDNVFAAVALARMYLSQGRIDEADATADRAVRRGIRRPELSTIRGDAAWLRGDRDAAREAYRQARSVSPRHGRAVSRLLTLDLEEITEELRAAYRRHVASIRKERAMGDEWPCSAVDEVMLHAAFGHVADAFAALDVAIDLGFRDAGWLLLAPTLASLREQPDFRERVARIRLLVQAERQRVLEADWLPPGLLAGKAVSK